MSSPVETKSSTTFPALVTIFPLLSLLLPLLLLLLPLLLLLLPDSYSMEASVAEFNPDVSFELFIVSEVFASELLLLLSLFPHAVIEQQSKVKPKIRGKVFFIFLFIPFIFDIAS